MADKSRLTKRVETFEKQCTSCKNTLMHYVDDKGPEMIIKPLTRVMLAEVLLAVWKMSFEAEYQTHLLVFLLSIRMDIIVPTRRLK